MSKFNLKAAKAALQVNQPMMSGFQRVIIKQVAEVGLHAAFNPGDEPKDSVGIVFENAAGQQVAKVMPLSVGTYANFSKMLLALNHEVDELSDLLDQELVLEIEVNGNWPKIVGYSPIEDGLSDQPHFSSPSPSLHYSVDEPDPEQLKQLHPQLRQAIAGRVRYKEK